MALWHTPYLDEKDPATQAAIAEAKAKKFYPLSVGPQLNKWGDPIDLTNPDAFAWWQGKINRYTALGIEGFKLDYAEDIVPGLTAARNKWEFGDGSDERTMHAGYSSSTTAVYAETLPPDGGFLLCRHATTGDQVNGLVIWPGDLDATFAKHREKVKDRGRQEYVSGRRPRRLDDRGALAGALGLSRSTAPTPAATATRRRTRSSSPAGSSRPRSRA